MSLPSSSLSSSRHLLTTLIDANKAILYQKLSLLSVLETKFGGSPHQNQDQDDNDRIKVLQNLFTRVCPIIKASIGQHYRHSMDHIELAALVASTSTSASASTSTSSLNLKDIRVPQRNDPVLRYDLRVRGGTLEKDVVLTRKRIHDVINIFQTIQDDVQNNNESDDDHDTKLAISDQSVKAAFMLSSSSDDEMELQSTIGRELGFCAHHAIHHLAMVKVIAVQTIGLEEGELPSNFGKAPSTSRFEVNS